MVATDCMMMRDRPAGRDQRVGGAGLDVPPLLDEPPGIAADVEGVIDGRPVRIDMREAHRDTALAACRFDQSVFRRLPHGLVERLEALPGDGGLGRIVADYHGNGPLAA